jgi:hypothetical protein
MLVYGTANPEGFGSETYAGLYLTTDDIDRITPQMLNIPVKVEHSVSVRVSVRVMAEIKLELPESDAGRHDGRD